MVCQRWRSVALSTSALWNTIWLQSHHLKAITLRSVSIKMLLALLEEYIRRCTTAINIRMDCNGPHLRMFNRIPMAIYHEILVTVTRYSARWGSVELSIDEPSFDILRSITTPLPMLCSLSITFWPTNNPTNNPTFTRLSILSQAPQLTTAHISTPLQLIQLPHVQLQKLRVDFHKPFTAYDYEALRDFVNLRRLHICISSGISGPFPPERLPFNQLVCLALVHGTEIMNHLTLPSLRELKLVRCIFSSLIELPMLCHMLVARSHCNIMHLHLNMVMITAQELSMLLDALPSITSLTLDNLPATTRDIFVALTHVPGRHRLVPLLRTMRVKRLSDDMVIAFLHFIETRLDEAPACEVAQLKKVHLGVDNQQAMRCVLPYHREIFSRQGFTLDAN
ncbi:hypothetical protein HGRIS_000280 [Hohenbuehelia grisea]|uniref:F-box domain-containing protein n=1 Tax=Hohenbuehelia grisea TaxID=104357 RepID=A0ABR3JRS4_9AGAR